MSETVSSFEAVVFMAGCVYLNGLRLRWRSRAWAAERERDRLRRELARVKR